MRSPDGRRSLSAAARFFSFAEIEAGDGSGLTFRVARRLSEFSAKPENSHGA
jgi:hypothetical protein